MLFLHGLVADVSALESVPYSLFEPSEHVDFIDAGFAHAAVSWAPQGTADPFDHHADEEIAKRDAVRHHDIISALSSATDMVPVRFGTVYSSPDALGQAIGEGRRMFQDQLAQIRGMAEYTIRFLPVALPKTNSSTETGASSAVTGRAFLRAKAETLSARRDKARLREAFLNEVEQALLTVVRGLYQHQPNGMEASTVKLTVLAEREPKAQFLDILHRLDEAARLVSLSMEVTGPWPCYIFTSHTEEVM